ncbi:Phosphatidylinositol 4,5-bisphosphate 3-kinase catalytic subunit alpha isoform [Nymphon striatum]|nr:Phosphatidylinositol 4,5-bisphosphate 3-kinase catalytic subunit alpha isoform [Nymphon striatum]
MPPSSGELWGHHLMPTVVTVDCLLPNGVIVPLNCPRDATLMNIKSNLWHEAKKFPLFHLLSEPSSYICVAITQEAEREEFYDETKRLCDLRLFQLVLKIIEPEGNKEEKMLNYEIGLAIGTPVHEFDEMKTIEGIDMRRSLVNVCKEAMELRDSNAEDTQALYAFPPDIECTPDLPPNIDMKLEKGTIIICVWVLSSTGDKQKYTVRVPKDAYPEKITAEAILKKVKSMLLPKAQQQQKVQEHVQSYLLKVCGYEQYLLAQYPICQYKYIRNCIARGEIPQLMLMSKEAVYKSLSCTPFQMPSFIRRVPPTNTVTTTTSLWKVDTMLRIRILSATYVNVKDVDKIYVRTGIYHGTEPLCPIVDTQKVVFSNPKWDEWLSYDLYISDIPRSAQFCVSICSVSKKKKREEHCALAWGNISLFDYKDLLLSDRYSLNLWPTIPTIKEYSKFVLKLEDDRFHHICGAASNLTIGEVNEFSQSDQDTLKDIIVRDPLSEISEQEKEFLWKSRLQCLKNPDSLPKLLEATKWNSRDDVSQLYVLINQWPNVSLETGLELLDFKYRDLVVRKFAVQSLSKSLSDEKLSQYLLQLVQVLKGEPYLNNDLALFLLKRALLNRKIGHFFFWHLKAEMCIPSLTVRFGLLLEAYCRGIGSHLKVLNRQVEALEKLTTLTDSLKEKRYEPHRDRLKFMIEQVKQADYLEALQSFPSPVDCTQILGEFNVEDCKILDSAKRPLWLVWKNPDPMAELVFKYNAIIFKNGDDLRQDMLTLQVIQVMDNIWQNEGMDLRMLPYRCLSTGKHVGMIEVVRNAKTIMGIQKKGGRMAAFQVDSTQLHKWIKEHNGGPKYAQAIETFSRSCAGYCVATFILGIGDRNPDNIMVNEQGQIFHIDFGHFLGHFKKKFGINRERVPFVLTEDFLYVIAKGAENPKKSVEFEKFQELCGKAYLILRKHCNLLITLFTMMLATGIPELQSMDDIGYLRKTLQVEKSAEEALQYFQNQFYEAYGGAWTTKLDWFFHRVKHM